MAGVLCSPALSDLSSDVYDVYCILLKKKLLLHGNSFAHKVLRGKAGFKRKRLGLAIKEP